MNNLHVIFLLCLILTQSAFSQSCNPDDEFETEETSPEWENFMDNITELTFKNYEMACQNDASQKVTINASSDILWDLRFTVYNERQSKKKETIDQCYAEQEKNQCDKSTFRECMKTARSGMLADVTSEWWTSRINEELSKLAEQC